MSNASIRRILVPVDLSSCSRAALEFAYSLADVLGASLDVLYVEEPRSGSPSTEGSLPAREELHRFVMSLRPKGSLSIAERIDAGDARERILAIAEQSKPDLIVLGTHGRTGRVRMLAGSVAEGVVRAATCPVTTVRDAS
jgi:nucleotide-binding universal stress UspA family protein